MMVLVSAIMMTMVMMMIVMMMTMMIWSQMPHQQCCIFKESALKRIKSHIVSLQWLVVLNKGAAFVYFSASKIYDGKHGQFARASPK